MDNNLQTSFIPKQTIRASTNPAPTEGGMGLFTLLSFMILFLSLLTAGGAFAYQQYLINHLYKDCEVTDQTQPNTDQLGLYSSVDRNCGLYLTLEDKKRALGAGGLTRMEGLDTKMKLATTVLSQHLTLLPLFDLLGTSTLKTIRFTKFSTSNGTVELNGLAGSYEDIAVEAKVLNKMPEVNDTVFSNLSVDQTGKVTFSLKFKVDPSKLRYLPAPTN